MTSEAKIQRDIQLTMAESGVLIFRNNCGQYRAESGAVVRFGIGNPGGSDLIGITRVTITHDMVGQTIGVFTAIEVKTDRGRPTENQIKFIETIRKMGGYAGVARSSDDAVKIIKG